MSNMYYIQGFHLFLIAICVSHEGRCIDVTAVVDAFTQVLQVAPSVVSYEDCPASANPTPLLELKFLINSASFIPLRHLAFPNVFVGDNCDQVGDAVQRVNATLGNLRSSQLSSRSTSSKKSGKFPLWAMYVPSFSVFRRYFADMFLQSIVASLWVV